MRELLRYRRKLVESQAAERNRLLMLLETTNIKLASVASDVFGVSGRAMLRAMIAGEASPETMADLAKGLLRRKRVDLILVLDGRVEEHRAVSTGNRPQAECDRDSPNCGRSREQVANALIRARSSRSRLTA
jgi:hypothetical protein